MTLVVLSLLGGLIALVVGGELLVRGAVGLAERAGVTPLLIGLVIVGFGTSMPELVTSVEAALAGSPAIAWGNILGSNIANSLLILGAAALIAPIVASAGTTMRDPLIALAATLAVLAIAISGIGHSMLGAAMLLALFAYVFWCYREERAAPLHGVHNAPHDRAEALELADAGLHGLGSTWWRPVMLTLAGLALLVGGGRFLVSGAIDLARLAGLSETLIGLTIVALGTSLPELVTSLIAARKGQAEVAFGNVVGSNIYNLLGIGGATMLIAPGPLPRDLLPFDIGLALASAVAILLLMAVFRGVGRSAAAVLLGGYAVYLVFLVVSA